MRRRNAQSLGDILQELLKENKLDTRLFEVKLVNVFPEVVGQAIASHTSNLYVKNQVLYAKIDSSIIRHELLLMKAKLVDQLNEAVGKEVIRDIVFR
jgi:predicted nucleic acid-binding Zn ribbon protein